MITELDLLRTLAIASMAVGPFATRRWLPVTSRRHGIAHGFALACAAAGVFAGAPILCVVWLAFCAGSFVVFLRTRALRTPRALATAAPFVFSNIAAVWLVGAANDLHLLGYGPLFSYYAVLHGNVTGWIVIGTLAILADRGEHAIHLASVLVCVVSFLLIAIGIDQLHALKPIGVVGLSIALPLSQLVFLRGAWSRHRPAFLLGAISLAGLVLAMVLAWRNELALPVWQPVPGVRGMVSVHGVINTLVVGPCFLLAVTLAAPDRESSRTR